VKLGRKLKAGRCKQACTVILVVSGRHATQVHVYFKDALHVEYLVLVLP
jgi:hypothetical protein